MLALGHIAHHITLPSKKIEKGKASGWCLIGPTCVLSRVPKQIGTILEQWRRALARSAHKKAPLSRGFPS
jgi:hypothetical protein